MESSALVEAREWLTLAHEDVVAAERLLQTPPPLVSVAAFQAEQAGENALRAYLAAHTITSSQAASLGELLAQCQAIDARFAQLSPAARTLSPYAVRFRYPGGRPVPTSAEAEEALQVADDIVEFVRKRLAL